MKDKELASVSQSAAIRDRSLAAPEVEPAAAGFTPGPWHIRPGDTPGFKTHSGMPGIYAPARPEDNFFILKIAELETNVPPQEVAANASLIEAASDLYYALLMCIQRIERPELSPDANVVLDRARAAKARALGTTDHG